MFDIGWSEILVIAIVIIIVVGPKDLPRMLRTFGKSVARMRATTNEFRLQFDKALKEAELDEVKTIVNELQTIDFPNNLKEIKTFPHPLSSEKENVPIHLNAVAGNDVVPVLPSSSIVTSQDHSKDAKEPVKQRRKQSSKIAQSLESKKMTSKTQTAALKRKEVSSVEAKTKTSTTAKKSSKTGSKA